MVMRDPAATSALFGPERDAAQARWLAAPPDPAAAFAEADELLARWTAAVAARPGSRDTRPAWARRYRQKRNTRAGLPSQAALSREGANSELSVLNSAAGLADRPVEAFHALEGLGGAVCQMAQSMRSMVPFQPVGCRRMFLSLGPDPGERHMITDVPAVVRDRTTRGGNRHAEAAAINDRHQPGARGSRW